MHRLILLGLCLNLLSPAQTIPMASSGDGTNFQFASDLWLKGEPFAGRLALPGFNLTRIYRHATPPVIEQPAPSNRYFLTPFISDDGLTQGSFTYLPCSPRCMGGFPRDVVTLQRAGQTHEFTGFSLHVSRNGRFILDSGFFQTPATLRDLDTGKIYDLKHLPVRPTQSPTNDGTLLSAEPGPIAGPGLPPESNQMLLVPLEGTPVVLFEGRAIRSVLLTPQGNSAFVLQQTSDRSFRLLEIDVATRTPREIWQGDTQPQGISTNTDGRLLLMQTAQQLLLWDRTSGWRSLFNHDAGLANALLTDSGNLVFATTRANAIYRIDTASGQDDQLYAPFPLRIRQASDGSYPGSLIRHEVDYSDPKLHFRVKDQDFPVVKAEAKILDVQIPWEFTEAIGRNEAFEVTAEDSPFSLRGEVFFARAPAPWIFTYLPPRGDTGFHLVAAQADFRSLVTPENPAPAGSLIHFWVTGLGPLDRPVATGEKGPVDPPAVPLEPLACYIRRTGNNPPVRGLRLPTVIYAPNLVGVYQIDAEIPADWPPGISNISCLGPNADGAFTQVTIGPPR